MQSLLPRKQHIFSFDVVRVWNAAIHWADGCALGLFMEAHALGAFIGHDVVIIVFDGGIFLIGFNLRTVTEGISAGDAGTL